MSFAIGSYSCRGDGPSLESQLRELELQQPGPIGLPDRKERLSAASGLVRLGLCRLDLILSCSRNGAAETGSS
jgi:hypothetical protein